jgi:regulator of replication initiation timing
MIEGLIHNDADLEEVRTNARWLEEICVHLQKENDRLRAENDELRNALDKFAEALDAAYDTLGKAANGTEGK